MNNRVQVEEGGDWHVIFVSDLHFEKIMKLLLGDSLFFIHDSPVSLAQMLCLPIFQFQETIRDP